MSLGFRDIDDLNFPNLRTFWVTSSLNMVMLTGVFDFHYGVSY